LYEFELSEVLNMKVLFLDVDGVLNCMGCKVKTPSGFKFVETVFLERVKKIVDETGCVVVLSSTWRHGFYDLQRGIENSVDARDYILLKDKLSDYGVEIYSHTPELREYHRGTEILEWLYWSVLTRAEITTTRKRYRICLFRNTDNRKNFVKEV